MPQTVSRGWCYFQLPLSSACSSANEPPLHCSIENAQVQKSNFHHYPLLRYDEMPQIEVHLVRSERPPSGVGEIGTPPIIPAVANAIVAATGKRIRRIPVLPGDLLGA